jgi:transposase
LQHIVRRSRDHLLVQRARILLLLWELRLVCAVVERVGCARASVYRTLARFRAHGEESLVDARSQRAPLKLSPMVSTLVTEYLSRPPSVWGWHRSTWSLRLLREQLRREHALVLSKSLLWGLLRRLDYRRLRPRPALRIPVQGRGATIRRLRKLARHSSPQTPVFYVDEADLDLNPRIGAVWARRGRQPLVLTPGQNRKHYLAGALCAHSGTLVFCDGPRKTSALFVALLEQLLIRFAACPTLHLILDNVRREACQRPGTARSPPLPGRAG